MDAVTTFSDRSESERTAVALDRPGLAHSTISPDPACDRVGCVAIVLSRKAKARFVDAAGSDVVNAGWIDSRPPALAVPDQPSPAFAEDGSAASSFSRPASPTATDSASSPASLAMRPRPCRTWMPN
jgi:hypothetical protein